MDYTTIILAAIASLPGIFAIVSQIRKDRNEARKTDVEAIDVAQKSVTVLLEPLNKRIGELETLGTSCKAKLDEMEKLIEKKNDRIAELENIVAAKDQRIAALQEEVDELRQRIVTLENGNGGSK